MGSPPQSIPAKNARVVGEPMVWLTSMGLTVGLVLVAGLLLLVAWNGLSVFWPKTITRYTIAGATPGDRTVVDGVLVKIQEKRAQERGAERIEIQIYTGNRDTLGQPFRFIDEGAIVGRAHPDEIMAIEREQNGMVLAEPLALKLAGGGDVQASSPAFAARFAAALDEAADVRDQVRGKQTAIDADSRRIEDLRIRLKSMALGDARREAIDADIAKLDRSGEARSVETRELREKLDQHALLVRLAGGMEQTIPIGQVVDHHYPNQLGAFGRIGRFAHNIFTFVTAEPREANTEGGIFPAIFGTFVMTLLMSVAVVPFGVLAAIYLREYAKQGAFVRMVRIAVNNLAGVPSIVFGVFGLGFFVYITGSSIDSLLYSDRLPSPTFGTGGILWSALTLALMTVPVVIVATEEAVASVPRGAREGSLACGASKWQTIQRIVLPASVPGILTGLILAMARGAGEVAPLMLVGVVKSAPSLPISTTWEPNDLIPFVHLDQKFMHLGFHIYDLGFQSPDSDAAKPMVFATTLILILLVVLLNLGAIMIREHLRRRYASAAF